MEIKMRNVLVNTYTEEKAVLRKEDKYSEQIEIERFLKKFLDGVDSKRVNIDITITEIPTTVIAIVEEKEGE